MRYLLRFIVVVAVIGVVACDNRPEADNGIDWSTHNAIVAYGTSLTAGIVEPDSSYPAFLGEMLAIDVVNRGEIGATSAWGVANIDTIFSSDPVLVLLEFGANDFLQSIDVDSAADNIAWMIQQIEAYGAEVALLNFANPDMIDQINANPLLRYLAESGGNKTLQAFTTVGLQFDAMIDSLAKHYDLEKVDYLYEGIAWNPLYLSADFIHPNAAGNMIMASNVFDAMEETFQASDMVD